MKKLFTLIVAVFVGMSAYADNTIEKLIEAAVADAIDAGKTSASISLNKSVTYTLNEPVSVQYIEFTINGNGATIKAGAQGQIKTKKSLTIDNVVLDASAMENSKRIAPIAMAPKADMTAKEDTAACYTYDAATSQYKYAGAGQKVFEAQLISLTNSTITVANGGFVAGNDAPWALRKLNVDNCIISFKTGATDPAINWAKGANSIQTISLTNNTIYSEDKDNNTMQYGILRYSNASNAQPQKVWGTDGTSIWTMTSNTIVNMPATGKFSNNYSNKSNCTLDWKNNVFANCQYLQKTASSAVRTFTNADNVISGTTNPVDATDKTTYATEDNDMKVFCTADDYQFAAAKNSYAYMHLFGDPRHITSDQKEYAETTTNAAKDTLRAYIAKGVDVLDDANYSDVQGSAREALNAAVAKGDSVLTNSASWYKDFVSATELLKSRISTFKNNKVVEKTITISETIAAGESKDIAVTGTSLSISVKASTDGSVTPYGQNGAFAIKGQATFGAKNTQSTDNQKITKVVLELDTPSAPQAKGVTALAAGEQDVDGWIYNSNAKTLTKNCAGEGESNVTTPSAASLIAAGIISSLTETLRVKSMSISTHGVLTSIRGISNVADSNSSLEGTYKFVENGKVVIMNNGKKFNANGARMK